MDQIIGWIVGGMGILLMFLIGAVWQIMAAKIAAVVAENATLRVELSAFKVKVAESYPSREALKDMLEPIMEELRKIDRKLDSKADKP